jgi:hypothetical protein
MSIPLRIHGPAIVQFKGVSYYFKTGLKGAVKRTLAKISVDAFGQIAEVAKDCVVEFTGTPAGAIRAADLAGQMPYLPSNIGQSIFGVTDASLTIQTMNDGAAITWQRGAISKYAPILLSATMGTLYQGDMTFCCLMASTFNPGASGAWKNVTQNAFTDATFDPVSIQPAEYTAAWGSVAPYNCMIAQDGFLLSPSIATENLSVDNCGIIDMALKSVGGSVRFKPANLSEPQLDALISLQGASAMLPGAVLGDGGNDLVITSNRLVATLKMADAVDYGLLYATGRLRAGEVAFAAATTFATGVPNPIFTFAVV